jgi:hypothetical protein
MNLTIDNLNLPPQVMEHLNDIRDFGDLHTKAEIDMYATSQVATLRAKGWQFSGRPNSTDSDSKTLGTDVFDEVVQAAYLNNAMGFLRHLKNSNFKPKNAQVVLSIGQDILALTSTLGEKGRLIQSQILKAEKAAYARIPNSAPDTRDIEKPNNLWNAASRMATIAYRATEAFLKHRPFQNGLHR